MGYTDVIVSSINLLICEISVVIILFIAYLNLFSILDEIRLISLSVCLILTCSWMYTNLLILTNIIIGNIAQKISVIFVQYLGIYVSSCIFIIYTFQFKNMNEKIQFIEYVVIIFFCTLVFSLIFVVNIYAVYYHNKKFWKAKKEKHVIKSIAQKKDNIKIEKETEEKIEEIKETKENNIKIEEEPLIQL